MTNSARPKHMPARAQSSCARNGMPIAASRKPGRLRHRRQSCVQSVPANVIANAGSPLRGAAGRRLRAFPGVPRSHDRRSIVVMLTADTMGTSATTSAHALAVHSSRSTLPGVRPAAGNQSSNLQKKRDLINQPLITISHRPRSALLCLYLYLQRLSGSTWST